MSWFKKPPTKHEKTEARKARDLKLLIGKQTEEEVC